MSIQNKPPAYYYTRYPVVSYIRPLAQVGTYIQYTTDIQYSISGTVVYTVSGLRPGIHVRSVVDPDDFCPVPDP